MQAKLLRHIQPAEDLREIAAALPGSVTPVDPAGMDLTIYTVPTSICSQRVRMTMGEKQLRYTERTVNGHAMENLQPWYLKINPRGLVPALTFDDRSIFDSKTMMTFIDNYFIGPRLSPTESGAHASMHAWVKRFDEFPVRDLSFRWQLQRMKKGQPDYWTPGMHDAVVRAMEIHPENRELYQRKLDEWQDILTCVNDASHMAACERQAQDLASDVDAAVSGDAYLVGASFTLADISAIATLVRLQCGCGLRLWGNGLRPALERYVERLKQRPSYQTGLLDPYSQSEVFKLEGDCWYPKLAA